jgi:dolichol-phosphate mannosyltransferase
MNNMVNPESRPIVCVILPTYNEVANIPIIIPKIFEQQAKISAYLLHVLVVDDDSPDGTQDVVRGLMQNYPNLHLITGPKKGLGDAYKRGMAWAAKELDPDLLFEMDADLQHDPVLIPDFISLAENGFSLVIGSRFAPGGSTPTFSLLRKLISWTGNWLIRYLGGIPRITDCTSGYRCIKADLIRKCDLSFLSTRGYSFQSSLLCELLRNGARVVEVPIIFADRQSGDSKLALRDQVEFVLNIPRIRFNQSRVFVKFCIVGASGVLVNMGCYAAFTRLLGLPLEIASPIAIEFSILSNFTLNHLWTFRWRQTHGSWRDKIVKFHMVASLAAILNYATLLGLVNLLGVWDIAANLIGIAIGTIVNYSMNSFWTWKIQKIEALHSNTTKTFAIKNR